MVDDRMNTIEQEKHKIIFAADLRDPTIDATSTQIMTANLLKGFRQIASSLVLVAMVCDDVDRDTVRRYYGELADEIVFVRRITGERSKYKELAIMLKGCMSFRFREEKQLAEKIDDQTYLISHTPTIDAALLCRRLMKFARPKRYIQYWSDPQALSLLTPGQYSFKRWPYKWIEKKLHRFADDIVYGTKPLYEAQKELFGSTPAARRMAYCDVAYIDYSDEKPASHDELVFGYIGNYYSGIRNLQPLYNAFQKVRAGELVICGSGDLSLAQTERIRIMERVPQSEIHRIERQIGIEICVLNRVGIQVPGKIFYEAATDKQILVITDGPIASDIKEYLSGFRRYVFCENEENSIREAIDRFADGYTESDRSQIYRLSPAYVASTILSGGFNDEKRAEFEQDG